MSNIGTKLPPSDGGRWPIPDSPLLNKNLRIIDIEVGVGSIQAGLTPICSPEEEMPASPHTGGNHLPDGPSGSPYAAIRTNIKIVDAFMSGGIATTISSDRKIFVNLLSPYPFTDFRDNKGSLGLFVEADADLKCPFEYYQFYGTSAGECRGLAKEEQTLVVGYYLLATECSRYRADGKYYNFPSQANNELNAHMAGYIETAVVASASLNGRFNQSIVAVEVYEMLPTDIYEDVHSRFLTRLQRYTDLGD